jgi:dihydroorotate dehydrogenase (NAD+) catalytic subunit
LMMVGANAVQVGTATFADPRAALKIQRAMLRWAHRRGVTSWDNVIGSAH